MKMVRQNKINFLQPEWAQNFPLYAGFSTRNGGVSRPPFHSLNLGFNTEDTLYNEQPDPNRWHYEIKALTAHLLRSDREFFRPSET